MRLRIIPAVSTPERFDAARFFAARLPKAPEPAPAPRAPEPLIHVAQVRTSSRVSRHINSPGRWR